MASARLRQTPGPLWYLPLVSEHSNAGAWGKNYIVVAHDWSQIEAADFVYLLKEGCSIVE